MSMFDERAFLFYENSYSWTNLATFNYSQVALKQSSMRSEVVEHL